MSHSSLTNVTRASLLARAALHDEAAWESLVDLYGPLVGAWCKRTGLTGDTIADVTQDVFVTVFKSLSDFRSVPGTGVFRAWLWRITKNKLTDVARSGGSRLNAKGGSTANRAIAQTIDPSFIPCEEPSDAQEISQLMQRALTQVQCEFESRTWQAFWRTAVDSIATSVVAEELGMSLSGVRQARCRVMRRLRQQLGDVGTVA